jgi:hypothetical protein
MMKRTAVAAAVAAVTRETVTAVLMRSQVGSRQWARTQAVSMTTKGRAFLFVVDRNIDGLTRFGVERI